MSLNGIAASALSALQTNSAALGAVSNNVANLNTPGYARRVVNEQTLAMNGQLVGVEIGSIQRVVDTFLQQENLAASGSASQYDTMAGLFTQLNGLLGGPGDNQSMATGLTSLASAFGLASQATTSSASYTSVLNALNNVASQIGNVSSTISTLQSQVDQQVSSAIPSTNTLIQQIYQLNQQIKTATASGSDASALADQRDVALNTLSKTIGVRVTQQPDGGVNVTTTDGINLISNTYAVLSYPGGPQNGAYGNIQIQDVNPQTGQLIGQAIALDPHLSGGSLKGLIDMRDQTLGGLAQSLGNFAQATADAFNAQANANAAYPPPTSLTGRDTGLLSTDGLNFSGKTTIAVADSSGNLVSRIDVDFDAGTLSVDGGGNVAIGSTVGSFTTALNAALGGNGSASFTDGKLSIAANGGNGIVVQDDATTPSSRGGTGFSQFFGLNDLFTAQAPSILSTGLSASDSSGLAAGGTISLSLKGPDGDIVKQVSVTTTAGQTIGDVLTALNTAHGRCRRLHPQQRRIGLHRDLGALFRLPAQCHRRHHPAWHHRHELHPDFRHRRQQSRQPGGRLFGHLRDPERPPAHRFRHARQITASSAAGDTIVEGGDNSGAIALQNLINQPLSFAAAGGISAQTASLSDYAAAFYQNVSTLSNAVTTNQTTQDDRLQEAQSRMASQSGVNLDEELTNLTHLSAGL